jgi:hypothetical protein
MGLAACVFYLRKFEPARNLSEAVRDAAIGGIGVLVLFAVLWNGRR